jgi:hypothetical protein
MRVYKKSGTKERLFEMFENVNKIKLNESFDSPKEKDEKYLDNTVGTEDSQVSKYDDGVRYPVEKELKVKDPSLEKLKGDDAPIEECADCDDPEDDQDIADENEPVNVGDTEPEDNDGEGEPAMDAGFEDEIEGGLADDNLPSDFDPEQIVKGIKVEMEHTSDPHQALEIAMDHLKEIPDYYDRLADMEAEAKGEGEASPEDDMEAPEDSLLDPSKHWVDDYAPINVESINYPTPLADPEAGEEEWEEMEKLKSGEFEEDDLDAQEDADWEERIKSGQMKPINKVEEDQNQGSLEDRYEIYVKNADDGNGNDITTGEPLLTFDEWLNS